MPSIQLHYRDKSKLLISNRPSESLSNPTDIGQLTCRIFSLSPIEGEGQGERAPLVRLAPVYGFVLSLLRCYNVRQ